MDNPYVYKIILAQSSERVLFGPKALLMWFTEISRIVVNNKIHCRTSVLSQQTFLVFQDVFSVTLFVFQDLFKTSSRRLQDVFKTYLQYVFRKCLPVFKTYMQYVYRKCLQDVLEDKKMLHWRRLADVFCTSSQRRMFAGMYCVGLWILNEYF